MRRILTLGCAFLFARTAFAANFTDGYLGLWPRANLELTSGRCRHCNAPTEGLWYFEPEVIAVPKKGTPGLFWVSAPEMAHDALLSSDGRSVRTANAGAMTLTLVPKIPSNRSYYNTSTTAFFQNKLLRLRGRMDRAGGARQFTARTIWPEDYRIEVKNLRLQELHPGDTLTRLIVENHGGAQSPFSARLIWERYPGRRTSWARRAVIGLMLNGAQGDDDESLGGHFGLVTGRMGPRGEMADWVMNNFYSLDEESEKGILAGMVPMDNYLMDLNSGQSYYRPSYMIVAVLKNDRTARQLQEILQKTLIRYYRHDLRYGSTSANCTGISMDVLRSDEIGWKVPYWGSENILMSAGGFLYASIKAASLQSGKKIFDYMTEEKTRLFPRAAFESAGMDILRIVREETRSRGNAFLALSNNEASAGELRRLTPFEQRLSEDAEALIFVRIPQTPSSRALGSYPVLSLAEYRARTPADHSKWKIVAVAPRPFPPPH